MIVWAQEKIDGRLIERQMRQEGRSAPPSDDDAIAILGILGALLGSVLLVGTAGWGTYKIGVWLLAVAPDAYIHKTPLNFALAIAFTFSVAGLFYYLRELKPVWYLYPPIELGISAGLSATAVAQQSNPILSMIALLAAVRVAVDGINRLIMFRKRSRETTKNTVAKA